MIYIFKKVISLSLLQSQLYTKTAAVTLCCPLHCLEQRSWLSEVLCSPSFSHAWAWLDGVWAHLKPDDVHWATAVVQPLQQLWRTEKGCDRSTHSAEIQAIAMFFADPWVVVKGLAYGTCVPLGKLQTDRLKTPLEVGAMSCGNKLWLLLELSESHTLMRCIGVKPLVSLHHLDYHHCCVDKP